MSSDSSFPILNSLRRPHSPLLPDLRPVLSCFQPGQTIIEVDELATDVDKFDRRMTRPLYDRVYLLLGCRNMCLAIPKLHHRSCSTTILQTSALQFPEENRFLRTGKYPDCVVKRQTHLAFHNRFPE